ncbi:MAG TPA: hypothetical protein VFY29_07080 [Terriglobia bacterium]|nr:hypothetical protein [Terriglobia bacterium]
MQKGVIAILSVCLGAALLVIAFLAGRLSVSPPASPPGAIAESRESVPSSAPAPAPVYAAPAPRPSSSVRPSAPQPSVQPPPRTREREQPAAPPPVPRPRSPQQPDGAANSSGAIAAYFARMDAIQVAGSGDPTAFAEGILGGTQAGDFSGMDALVSSSRRALAEANAVQPPSACVEYHRRLIGLLAESISGMEQLRAAVQTSDLDALASIALQFQVTQQKIGELESLKRQLLAR